MKTPELEALVAPVLAIARQAGAKILEVYRQPLDVTTKADESPLTIADLRSHETIVRGLINLEPALPILSEEANTVAYETRAQWRAFWLVDPLDGTKEFLKRNDEFTVNIALIEDHVPALGVVYVPATDAIYWGGSGIGAFRQIAREPIEAIHVCSRAPRKVRVVGSRSHANDTLAKNLPRLGEHELVQVGSSIKFCAIAEGRADVYPRFGPTSEWDTAAAQAVVEGAGGLVLDAEGAPLRYNTKESLINPHFVAFGDRSRDWVRILFSTD
ncbi:MAG TPA: 3'(2'),5'-bisphosphate nucleotidase CysQ [Steroidobacteraceae bacterium]